MSAGVFERAKYQASYGDGTAIHPIRVQPEVILASIGTTPNNEPTGNISNPISASISNGKRALGLTPRYVTLQAPEVGQPSGYKAGGITRIPALTQTFWDAAVRGATCSYLDVDYEVVSRSVEEAK